MSSHRSPLLTLIVAAAQPGYGIGKAGALPWPMLKGEMGFFSRVTKRVNPPHASESKTVANAIIMGRKTWDSIPEKLRPLKGRVNVVVSSSMTQPSLNEGSLEGPFIYSSLDDALKMLSRSQCTPKANPEAKGSSALGGGSVRPPATTEISRTFVIGGSSLYEAALQLGTARRLLVTKVRKTYECDVFFPIDPDSTSSTASGWRRRSAQEWADWTGEFADGKSKGTEREENDVPYEFCLYEREEANLEHPDETPVSQSL
ncbi:MAG: hypothetical protein Q9159_006325 [Coniocarpon cinnabarinum]